MRNKTRGKRSGQWLIQGILVLGIAWLGVDGFRPSLAKGEDLGQPKMQFHDVRLQTREFHAYNRSISLNAKQRAVMHEALSGLHAPCCSNKTAATCCCPCNMAKTWWGLSKHLITERGYGSDEVREAVVDWIQFINPDGFTGDACYSGGCDRPFHKNGCGGMEEKRVKF